MGRKMAQEMKTSLYQGHADRILNIAIFTGKEGSEIEDLIPPKLIASTVDRLFRVAEPEDEFVPALTSGPIIPQIEGWAKKHDLDLPDGWKVILAKQIKQYLLARGMAEVNPSVVEIWTKLFNELDRRLDD